MGSEKTAENRVVTRPRRRVFRVRNVSVYVFYIDVTRFIRHKDVLEERAAIYTAEIVCDLPTGFYTIKNLGKNIHARIYNTRGKTKNFINS